MNTIVATAVFALLLLALLLLPSVQDTQAYTNSEYGFSVTAPAGWTTTENQLGADVIFKASDGTSINVVVVDSGGLTLHEVVPSLGSSWSDAIKNTAGVSNYSLISQGYHTYGSNEGYEVVQTFAMYQIIFKDKQVLFVVADHGYIVTCTAFASNYESYISTFDNCLASFTATSATPSPTPQTPSPSAPTPTPTTAPTPAPTTTPTPTATATPTHTPTIPPTATPSTTSPTPTLTAQPTAMPSPEQKSTSSLPNEYLYIIVAAVIIASIVIAAIALKKRNKKGIQNNNYPPPPPPPPPSRICPQD